MKNEFIELLGSLVEFKTTVDYPQNKHLIINYVKNWFDKFNIENEIYQHKNNPSIIATIKGNINKTILFSSHLDVVPADDEDFKIKIEKDIIFGRGVSDDKGQATMGMLLIKKLSTLKNKPTIKLVLTTDEEIGGFDGVYKLVKEDKLDSDLVLVFDFGCEEHQIALEEKGSIMFKLIATGSSAHASRPWHGNNAIDKLIKNILKIQTYFDHSKYKPDYWCTTCNLSKINGGVANNQVPDNAEATLDIRFVDDNTPNSILKKIQELIDPDIIIEKIIEIPYFKSNKNNPLIDLYIESMSISLNKKIEIIKMYGATDGRHFVEKNIPVILASPKNGGHHQKREWLDINSTERFFNAILEYIKKIK